MQKSLTLLLLPLALTGCLDRFDHHGIDPRAYHEVIYPKKNKVEFNSVFQSFYFDGDSFTNPTLAELNEFTSRTYPTAVDRLVIATPQPDEARTLYVTRLLRTRGFKKSSMEYVVDESLASNEVVVQMDYSYVVSPNCPDWRKSTNLNYSNTNFSNMECATVVNLGKQIANPRHLIESDGLYVNPDGQVGAKAITDYHTGDITETATEAANANSTAQ